MYRRIGLWAIAAVFCIAATNVQAQKMAVGAFTGINIPVAQDDATEGSVWGVRAQLQAIPLFRVEPRLSFIKNGDYEISGLGGTFKLDGGDLTGIGFDVVLGSPMSVPGVGVGLLAGIGSYKRKVDYQDDVTNAGYNVGLDVGLGIGPIRAGARGEFLVIPQDPKGSRKHVLLTIGASYAFGSK